MLPLVFDIDCRGFAFGAAIEAGPSGEMVIMLRIPQMADRRVPAHSLVYMSGTARVGNREYDIRGVVSKCQD
jgi:hypothetical protein